MNVPEDAGRLSKWHSGMNCFKEIDLQILKSISTLPEHRPAWQCTCSWGREWGNQTCSFSIAICLLYKKEKINSHPSQNLQWCSRPSIKTFMAANDNYKQWRAWLAESECLSLPLHDSAKSTAGHWQLHALAHLGDILNSDILWGYIVRQ